MNKLYKDGVAMNKVIIAVLLGGSIFLSNLVLAEDLTIYQKITATKKFDLGEKGDSVGDIYTRIGNLYFKLDGPVVGAFYKNAIVTHIVKDTQSNFSWSPWTTEFNLPEGEILTMDYAKFERVKLGVKGWAGRGVILGGTGIYSGIRGSYDLSYTSDDATTVIFHIQK